jgi:hypothetical protein
MKSYTVLFFLALAGCATGCATSQPTPYAPQGADGFGYSVKPAGDNMNVAMFTGNKDTSPIHAYAFSILTAIDECAKKNKFAVIAKAVNQTKEVNVGDVAAKDAVDPTPRGQVPPPLKAADPFAAKVEIYPSYAEAFECRSSLYQLVGVPRTENMRPDLVKYLTKDDKGGVMLAFERGGFPEGVQDDDVVIILNRKRIGTNVEFYAAIDAAKAGPVMITVIRNNQIANAVSRIVDATEDLRSVERQTIDLMCDTMGIQLDELANIPAAAKAAPVRDEKSMSAGELSEYKSGKELCARLRGLSFLRSKKLAGSSGR